MSLARRVHAIASDLLGSSEFKVDDLLAFHRAQFGGARMEGEGGGAGEGEGGAGDEGDGSEGDAPNFTQADLDRIVKDRLAQERKKYADYPELKRKAAEAMSETERAVAEARETGRTEALSKVGERLVAAEFKAVGAAKDADVSALLDDLNLAKFVGDDGEPKTDEITAAVDRWAAAAGGGKRFKGGADQGRRQTSSDTESAERDAARKLFGSGS